MPGMARPVADERDALLTFLAGERYVLRLTAYGLTDEDIRKTPSASDLSIGGVIKHVAASERRWADMVAKRFRPRSVEEYMTDFRVEPEETAESILDDYADVAASTDALIADIPDLGQAVPVPKGVPWFPNDVDAWSVRWVLHHLIQETARHTGHADIIRESLDGATAFPLMAAAEGWSMPPLVEPWKPAARA
jgi:hypothetical protein